MKVMVVGADGLLGRSLSEQFRNAGHRVFGTTRRSPSVSEGANIFLDLAADPSAWPDLPSVDVAVICAAVASIKSCADDPVESARVNVDATIALAERLADRGSYVLFVSSNQIFDGSIPLIDRAAPYCPVSEYGRQKAAAEAALLAMTANVAVVRLSKVLTPTQPMLLSWCASLRASDTIRPFSDFTLAPVSVEHVISLIAAVVNNRELGVFQLSGGHDVSYVELACTIAMRAGADRRLVRPRPAIAALAGFETMPRFSSMDMSRERRLAGAPAPDSWAVINDVIDEVIAADTPRRVA